MIKDKNGNRVNFIRKFSHSQSTGSSTTMNYYNYTTQIKKQDGGTIWAAPACVCLPYSVSAASSYITCTRTKASEPKPQRSSNTTLYAGDYIYCGEEISMDCINSYYKTNYYSYPRIEYVISSDITMVSVLPKTFTFNPAYGYNSVAEAQGYDNNTDIVVGGDTQPRKMMLSASDFNGFMVFGNGTRPAFSSSGGKYVLTKSYSPTWDSTTQATWQLVHDHYDGGTFELKLAPASGFVQEQTRTGSISVSISTTGVNQGKYQKVMTIKLTCNFAVPARSGTEEQTRITLKPPSNASFLNQNTLARTASSDIFEKNYGIASPIFGEDVALYVNRIYTEQYEYSFDMSLQFNNNRLYDYIIKPIAVGWSEVNTGAEETDIITIPISEMLGDGTETDSYINDVMDITIANLKGVEGGGSQDNDITIQKLWARINSGLAIRIDYQFIFNIDNRIFAYNLSTNIPHSKMFIDNSERGS